MYTDQISDVYCDICDDIRKNRLHESQTKEEIIFQMTHLNIMKNGWMIIPESTDRARDEAEFDYQKAKKGIKLYSKPMWNNSSNFDSTGKKK